MSYVEGPRIRPLVQDDALAVLELVSRIAGLPTVGMTSEEFNPTEEEERQFLERYADPTFGFSFGAWLQGRLRGVLFLDRLQAHRRRHVLVLGMSVAPDAWGMGIGRALVARGLEAARRAEDVRRVELSVLANNARGLALFRGAGFVEEGRKKGSVSLPSGPVDELFFGLVADPEGGGGAR